MFTSVFSSRARDKTHAHIGSRSDVNRVGLVVKFSRHVVGRQRLHPVDLATMRRQVARAGELTTADLAPVRLLSGVHPLVVAQTPHAREGGVALGALERFDASVGAQVGVQARPLVVAHPADLAAVGSLPVVVQQVLVEVVAVAEGLGAARAGELPRGAVPLEVHLQQLDRLAAQVAHLPGAVAAVVVHLLLVLERHAARLAHQRLQLRLPPFQPLRVLLIRIRSRVAGKGRVTRCVHLNVTLRRLLLPTSLGVGLGFRLLGICVSVLLGRLCPSCSRKGRTTHSVNPSAAFC